MPAVKKTNQFLLKQYHDPKNSASYGGVSRFAKNQGISLKKAKAILENGLGDLQYIPLCKETLDIIQVQIAEAAGTLTTFG